LQDIYGLQHSYRKGHSDWFGSVWTEGSRGGGGYGKYHTAGGYDVEDSSLFGLPRRYCVVLCLPPSCWNSLRPAVVIQGLIIFVLCARDISETLEAQCRSSPIGELLKRVSGLPQQVTGLHIVVLRVIACAESLEGGRHPALLTQLRESIAPLLLPVVGSVIPPLRTGYRPDVTGISPRAIRSPSCSLYCTCAAGDQVTLIDRP
jgi:hypothetical protein